MVNGLVQSFSDFQHVSPRGPAPLEFLIQQVWIRAQEFLTSSSLPLSYDVVTFIKGTGGNQGGWAHVHSSPCIIHYLPILADLLVAFKKK